MIGVHIRIFVSENSRHHGMLLYEWIMEKAKTAGIPGATAERAIAGYGRHGTLHEESFFELAANLPVAIDFYLDERHAQTLLNLLENEKLGLYYIRSNVELGIL